MKKYIRAMSTNRDKAMWQAGSYVTEMMDHIIKILVYHDIRKQDVSHWISEIAAWIHKVDGVTLKPNNRKFKPSELENSLFKGMGDEVADYDRDLDIFQLRYIRRFYENGVTEPYPEFEITEELAEQYMDCCYDIMNTTTPMLIDKADHSIEEYKEVLTKIFNNYI